MKLTKPNREINGAIVRESSKVSNTVANKLSPLESQQWLSRINAKRRAQRKPPLANVSELGAEYLPELIDALRAKANSNLQSGEHSQIEPIELIASPWGLKQLIDADVKCTYLIEDCLVEGQPAITAGLPKTLKTTIEIDRALSLASGRPFLGKFEVAKKSRVFIASNESGHETIKRTLLGLAKQKKLGRKELSALEDRLLFGWQVPKISNEAMLKAFVQQAVDFNANVAIVDPLYMTLDDTQSSLVLTGQQLDRFCRALLSEGITPIMLDHVKRSSTNATYNRPIGLEDITGAGKAEYFRQWTCIGRRSNFDPASGTETGFRLHELWITFGGSTGHSSRWAVDVREIEMRNEHREREYDIHVRTTGELSAATIEIRNSKNAVQSHQKLVARQKKVQEALEGKGNGCTISEIKDVAGLTHTVAKEVIQSLVDNGTILKRPIKRCGKEIIVYLSMDADLGL